MKFDDIFIDETKLGTKLKTDEYQDFGKYPIIDQGQELIAGYTDREDGLFREVPAIIFGDHTRIIKYVDTPFFLGADGVKVLCCKLLDANYRYLYYALRNAKIPDTGYNRHFKWLKEVQIPYPDSQEQARIVSVLDKIEKIIDRKKKQLQALDDLVKARFVEIFGDPVANSSGWNQAALHEVTSKIGSGATPRGGKESYQAEGISLIRSMNVHDGQFEYKDLAHITDEQAEQLENVTVKPHDVFINITGASVARSCIVPDDVLPARVNQHVAIIRCKQDCIHPVFANNLFLNDRFKGLLLDIGESGGATRQAITKQQLEALLVILPPMELQEQFGSFVSQVGKSKVAVQKALNETQTLFDSLMQKYFG